jgi:hypothetical protein
MTPEELAVLDTWGRLDLVDEVVRLRAENAYLAPRQRAGQRIFNAVYALDPAFADSVRATDVDPFYDDTRCEAFLAAWLSRAVLERTAEVTAKAARMVEREGVPPVFVVDSVLGRDLFAASKGAVSRAPSSTSDPQPQEGVSAKKGAKQ